MSEREEGRYEVTDLGEGDVRLVIDGPGRRAIIPPADAICQRFGVEFESGTVVGFTRTRDLSETCWRVAQATAAIAEAATFHRQQGPREAALLDVLERELKSRSLSVEVGTELEGASGHHYTASLFVPEREAVLEPIGGEKAWNKAAAVYVEFGDLGRVNGYELVAVVDDRDAEVGEEVEGLLGQVGVVARWSRRDEWMDTISRGRLI